MYGNTGFFKHTCLIIPEKDVLDADIIGSGWHKMFLRWWHDLFLLSYTNANARSKDFYSSSHSARVERFRQFRQYKDRIHPMSKFRNFWEFLTLHVLIMNKLIFRFTSMFLYDELHIAWYYLGAFLEIILIMDLYVSTKTGYIDYEYKRVILDTKESVLNFCSKKLFLHFASAIPLHWFMFLRYGSQINCGLCKTNRFNCALKIISVISLFRVYEASSYWIKKHPKTLYIYKFIRILILGFLTMCQFFDFCNVVSMLIFINNGHVVETSYLALRIGVRYSHWGISIPNYRFICHEVYRIFSSLLFYGYTDLYMPPGKVFYLDQFTSLIAYVLANTFYAWSLLECFAFLSSMMYSTEESMKLKENALNYLRSAHLSNELDSKVLQYFSMKSTRLMLTERQNELCRSLPEELKKEIMISCYMNLVMRIPAFTAWPVPLVEKMVQFLIRKVYLTSDIVSLSGISGQGLMIVDVGVLAVYSDENVELGHLIDGDHFGELSLVTDKEICSSTVVAITPCTILLLEKTIFRNLIRSHSELFYSLKAQLKRKYRTAVDHTSETSLSFKSDSNRSMGSKPNQNINVPLI